MTVQREIRCSKLELRAEGSGKQPRIVGMAARFGAKTTIQRGLNEVIARGAFTKTLANGDDVVLNFNHDENKIFARTGAGTLKLRETDEGLMFDAEVDPEISYVNDLYRSIRAGNISECSFQFSTYPDGDSIGADPDESGAVLRTLKSVRLYDVSAVTYPAYGGGVTSVAARNVIATDVESRMVSLLATHGTEARRQKADALLAQIAQEENEEQTKRLRLRYQNLFN
jgi:HK97 family phage prohead protease